MDLYITAHDFRDGAWHDPSPHVVGSLDFRSLLECGQETTAVSKALFSLSQRDTYLSGRLGDFTRDGLDTHIRRGLVDGIEDSFGLTRGTIVSDTLRAIVAELLTQHGDPTGQTRWKPLLSDQIILGGFSVIWRDTKWTKPGADPVWRALALRVKQEDYRLIRQACMDAATSLAQANKTWREARDEYRSLLQQRLLRLRGGLPRLTPAMDAAEQAEVRRLHDLAALPEPQHYKRVLDAWSERLGLPPEMFVPPDLIFEGTLPHGTTITEDFNTADSDTLGPDLTWTEIEGDLDVSGNEAATTDLDTDNVARADTDLGDDDHYAQAKCGGASSGGVRKLGPMIRKDSSGTLTYYSGIIDVTASRWRVRKEITGTETIIASKLNGISNDGRTIKVEITGSSLELFNDGTSKITTTDTAISSGLRCGIWGRRGTQQYVALDDFEAADPGAAADVRNHIIPAYMRVNA